MTRNIKVEYRTRARRGGYTTTAKGSAATTVTDTRTGKVTYAVEVGALPEAVVLSPDGKYVALVIGNGSATVKTAANYKSVFGKLRVYKVGAGKLDHVGDAQLSHAFHGRVCVGRQARPRVAS